MCSLDWQQVKQGFEIFMQALLSTDGVAEAFRSQTVAVQNPKCASRTFYMISSSNEERDAWVEAIQTNIKAYSVGDVVL